MNKYQCLYGRDWYGQPTQGINYPYLDKVMIYKEDIYLKDSQDKIDNLGKLYKSDNKIYECVENEDGNAYWKEVVMNMYGYWTNKATGTYLNIKY